LLAWLDSDRELAGKKYEAIRQNLVAALFLARLGRSGRNGDETIDRVARKVSELSKTTPGPALYFYGVGKNVFGNVATRTPRNEFPKTESQKLLIGQTTGESDARYECLEKCLQETLVDNRRLALQYYRENKRVRSIFGARSLESWDLESKTSE